MTYELLKGPESVCKVPKLVVARFVSHSCILSHFLTRVKIDVHYSLPRDDQRGADKDKSQVCNLG